MNFKDILIREYSGHDYCSPFNAYDYSLIVTVYPDTLTCFISHNNYSSKKGHATIDYILDLDISLESTLRLLKCKNKIMRRI